MAKTYHRLAPRGAPGLLSLVIPLYNEEATLPHLRAKLVEFLDNLPFPSEVVIVNDGSSDRSLDLLLDWAGEDPRLRVLNLARNFGHQLAASAGLDHASGEAVVLMDADLQDPLEVIPVMVERYMAGYDVVMGKRTARLGESRFKRFTAWVFYRLMKLMIYHDLEEDVGDFRLISRACLEALNSMRETHRFLRGMVCWVGFPQTTVSYIRQPRTRGETKYPLRKMLKFAWTAAVSFSPVPLRLSFAFGLLTATAGLSEGVYAVARTMLGFYTVPGWTSLIVVVCLIGGAILMSIGVLGEYIARIYEESKGRPLYIVATRTNFATTAREGEGDLDRLNRILGAAQAQSHDYHPTATR